MGILDHLEAYLELDEDFIDLTEDIDKPVD